MQPQTVEEEKGRHATTRPNVIVTTSMLRLRNGEIGDINKWIKRILTAENSADRDSVKSESETERFPDERNQSGWLQ